MGIISITKCFTSNNIDNIKKIILLENFKVFYKSVIIFKFYYLITDNLQATATEKKNTIFLMRS